MPVYDRRCTDCERIERDKIEPIGHADYDCLAPVLGRPGERICAGVMLRTWLPGSANGVVDDSIPGGMEIKNALCHPDGTPRRFDSKSDIAREAKRLGWTNAVEHIGERGSDKSKHTTRWTSAPLMGKQEEERVDAWRAHEAKLQAELSRPL